MKLSEMKQIPLSNVNTESAIIVNNVITEGEGEAQVKKLEKVAVPVNSFATKNDVGIIADQSSQLIKIVQVLTNKVTEYEQILKTLSEKLDELNSKALTDKMKKLEKKVSALSDKIDNEILEY